MNLNELTYNPFDIDEYERFLLEVFNVNVNNRQNVSYLDDGYQNDNIIDLFYYGSFLDDDFNDIELYVIKLGNIDEYKILEDIIYNLLSLNQTNHAFIAVYSNYTDKWFYSYLFLEYMVRENKLVNYKSKIDDYIHWCGYVTCDNLLSQMLSIKVSNDNIKALLKNNPESLLIISLSQLIGNLDGYNENSTKKHNPYSLIINVLIHIINNTRPNSTLMRKVYDKILEIQKSTDEKISIDTIFELYCYLNRQESISKTHINTVCEDALIEYLTCNTIISRGDIVNYVKYAYDNRKLISKNIDEAMRNGGKSYTNMKIPLSIIYNIDSINTLLDKIRILDFSINSSLTITLLVKLIGKLKYVNRIIQGYENPSMERIVKATLKNNIYMITLNKKSIITAKTILGSDLNIMYTDALNLYDEYAHIKKELKNVNPEKSKSESISQIVERYNKTHFHTKMNIYFEENFKQKNGYEPLIYELDYKEVFTDNHKFDIIISNIEHVDLTGKKEVKKQLRRYEVYDNDQRYEYYFIEKALEIIADNGIIALILSDEYKTNENKKVCKLLKKNTILKMDNNELIYTKNQ